MSNERDERWAKYSALGIEEIRKRLGAHQYGDQEPLVREWLAHHEALGESEDRRNILAEAKNANDLARSANASALEANAIAREASDSAKRSASAARTANIIAAASAAAAIIAIVVSIIDLSHK